MLPLFRAGETLRSGININALKGSNYAVSTHKVAVEGGQGSQPSTPGGRASVMRYGFRTLHGYTVTIGIAVITSGYSDDMALTVSDPNDT